MNDNIRKQSDILSPDEIFSMMKDTSQLIAQNEVSTLSGAAVAAQTSNALSNNVEFLIL